MHGETLCRALFKTGVEFNLYNLIHIAYICEPCLGVDLEVKMLFFFFYLDDNVSFPGPCAIQFPVFFYHNNLSFLFHLLHVFLYLVKDTAVVLLSYTHKLEKTRKQ